MNEEQNRRRRWKPSERTRRVLSNLAKLALLILFCYFVLKYFAR